MADALPRVANLRESFEHRDELLVLGDRFLVAVDEDFIHDVVCEAAVRANDDGKYLVAFDASAAGKLHLARHGEAILALVQAAYTV